MLADIVRMKVPLERTKAKIVGSTAVRLEGDPIQCRLRECNSGMSNLSYCICSEVDMDVILNGFDIEEIHFCGEVLVRILLYAWHYKLYLPNND